MARKYINLFDEQGNPTQVPLGADAENVDIEPINGLEAENVQEAIEELAGQQTTIEMDDVPTANSQKAVKSGGVYTALAGKQKTLTAGQNISISQDGVISASGSSVNVRGTIEQVPEVTWANGYIDANGAVGASVSFKVSSLIHVTNKQNKYIFLPGYFDKKTGGDDWVMYAKLNSSSEVVNAQKFNVWGRSYLVVPITSNDEYYRFCMKNTYSSYGGVYIVDLDWLISAGYADVWAGKKWAMYGDSYVYGHNIGQSNTWYNVFAFLHFAKISNLGHNGYGLVSSGNYSSSSLLSNLTTDLLDNGEPLDVEVIGVCCGRNDYSNGVPIGDIDDMITEVGTNPQYPASYSGDVTFMGGLNYLCKWLLDNYPTKRIFLITPWYFLNDNPTGNAVAEPVEYVDAVKTIAGKWGIPCFDAARQSGISVQSETFRSTYFLSSSDTSHLNYAGHCRMARGPVSKWLENLFSE